MKEPGTEKTPQMILAYVFECPLKHGSATMDVPGDNGQQILDGGKSNICIQSEI